MVVFRRNPEGANLLNLALPTRLSVIAVNTVIAAHCWPRGCRCTLSGIASIHFSLNPPTFLSGPTGIVRRHISRDLVSAMCRRTGFISVDNVFAPDAFVNVGVLGVTDKRSQ